MRRHVFALLLVSAIFCAQQSGATVQQAGSPAYLTTTDGRVLVGLVKSVSDGVVVLARRDGDIVVRLDQISPAALVALGAAIGDDQALRLFDAAAVEKRIAELTTQLAEARAAIVRLQTENLNLRIELETMKQNVQHAGSPTR